MSRFVDKKVVVTGGTRGIGRAIVEQLLREGAFVCFSARRQKSVDAAIQELSAIYGSDRIMGVVSNLGRENRVNLVQKAVELWGEIHGLVLNAAISPPVTSVLEAEERIISKIFATNVTANALLVQEAIPHLVEGEASIVFISSTAAYNPTFPLPIYGGLTRTLFSTVYK